jgi:hypothetical protein
MVLKSARRLVTLNANFVAFPTFFRRMPDYGEWQFFHAHPNSKFIITTQFLVEIYTTSAINMKHRPNKNSATVNARYTKPIRETANVSD